MIDEKEKEFLNSLVAKNIVSREKASDFLRLLLNSEKTLDDLLVEGKILTLEQIVELKAEIAKMEYRDIGHAPLGEAALAVIPFEVAQNYKIACFEKNGSQIKVGLIDPFNSKAIEAVNFLAKEQGLVPEFYLISEDNLNNIFNQYRNLEKEVSTALESKAKEVSELGMMEEGMAEELMEENVLTAPVARIVSVIIRHAVEEKASDIHIEPLPKETRVRYRIDGLLRTSLVLPKSIHNALVGRVKVLAKLKIDETRVPQDGRIRLLVNKKEIDFRISVMPLLGEEKIVMRILDLGKGIPTLEELGYDSRSLRVVKETIKKTFGLFLITGPTGSGKSTTLAAVLNMMNKEEVNIVTLEDPVEYFIKGTNQSQIKPAIGYSFANGLRSILRQDPDIVMVGEVRDNETAELCINAGLTGHFVLSTLHTNNAIDVMPRLIDMKVEPFLLASTLKSAVAQRLTRRICDNCKGPMEKIEPQLIEKVRQELARVPGYMLSERLKGVKSVKDINESFFYEGKGCPNCKNTGYTGRIAIIEVIEINEKIQKMILDTTKIIHDEDIRANQEFITMKEDGILKALQGITTLQEVYRVIQD
ncbi:MAG TPA: GspE/PulE family protein [Candidatus Methylomirabilis sp.]|nr:GspE/PulE family protein [Candidatus Methylomirabilis sp.]